MISVTTWGDRIPATLTQPECSGDAGTSTTCTCQRGSMHYGSNDTNSRYRHYEQTPQGRSYQTRGVRTHVGAEIDGGIVYSGALCKASAQTSHRVRCFFLSESANPQNISQRTKFKCQARLPSIYTQTHMVADHNRGDACLRCKAQRQGARV